MKQSSIHRTAFGANGSRLISDELGFVHLTIAAARAAGISLRLARQHARHNRAIVRDILEKSAPRYELEQAQADADLAAAANNRTAYMRATRRADRALESLDKRAMRPHEKPGPPEVLIDYGWEGLSLTIHSRRGETVEAFDRRVAVERARIAHSSSRFLAAAIRRTSFEAAAATTREDAERLKCEVLALVELFRKAAAVAPNDAFADIVAEGLTALKSAAEARQ